MVVDRDARDGALPKWAPRGHLVPSLSLSSGGNVELARSWVDQLKTLIRLSLRVLETDQNAVANAFGWLDPVPGIEQPDDGADNDDVSSG